MTFKVKGGIQIGANSAVDTDALFQQIELGPSVRPTLLLDFARSKTVDSRISFARSTGASLVAADGLIRYVGVNQPRIEHDPTTGECKGLLIEAGRYNEMRFSEGFANNTYGLKNNLRVAENVATAPDGTFTATRLFASVDASANYHYIAHPGVTWTPSTIVTQSLFAKRGDVDRIALYPCNSSNGVWFNILTGTVSSNDTGTTGTITSYANGWYRCTATVTANATATTIYPGFYTVSTSGTSYVGNNDTTYIWGHQVENIGFASSYIPAIPTFSSRASNGTYYDANGILQTAASNVARYSYTPSNLSLAPKLLTEQASTNLLTYSMHFDTANWTKGADITATANTTTAPDGTNTGQTITKAANTNYSFVRQGFAAISSNTTYTISCFVKKNNYRYVGLRAASGTLPSGATGGDHATFDFDTETFAYAPADYKTGFQKINNGWYRIYATVNLTVASMSGSWQLGICIPNALGQEIWDSTASGALSVYAWGMQGETNFLTSYIPTTTSATRATDAVTSTPGLRETEYANVAISTANVVTSEGTLYFEGRVESEATSNEYLIDFGDGTVNELTAIRSISGQLQFVQYTGGSSQGTVTLESPYTTGTPFKVAVAFSNSSYVGVSNGTIKGVVGPFNGILPFGTLTLGAGYNGAGTARRLLIKSASYYPSKLSNTEMIAITST